MNIVESIEREIKRINNEFMAQAEDGYNFWEEHVKFAVEEAHALAEKYGADAEIVCLGAMLHDVASMTKNGARAEHHIIGAEMAETLLKKYGYDAAKIDKVKQCVLNHRSSKECATLEEICVADGDILSHFRNILMCVNSAIKYGGHNSLSELRQRIAEGFEKDFNDLSERTKQDFYGRYKLICEILLGF